MLMPTTLGILGSPLQALTPGGILVQQVKEGPAKEAGIRKGDVLMMLNNEKIKDVSHLKALVDALPKDKSTAVLVQRASGPVFLAMKVPE